MFRNADSKTRYPRHIEARTKSEVLAIVFLAALAGLPPRSHAAPADLAPSAPYPSGVDRSFLQFLRQAEAETTPVVETTRTVPLVEGMATPTKPVEIPDWLSGPTTGSVMGMPLPLSLEHAVELALHHNFDIRSSKYDVEIAQSQYKQERYEFVPFVDLLSGVQYTDTKTGLRMGSGLEKTKETDINVGLRASQKFPTGGDVTIENMVDRRRIRDYFRAETADPVTGRVTDVAHNSLVTEEYQNSLQVTARQPLLRGGGFAVGMANLRLARLGDIDTELLDFIRRRDVVLSVIRQYFVILQRQLDARVSLDAMAEKEKFLSETKFKVQLGEIAPIEIGRAEIFLLNEQERSQRLKQNFLDSLDRLLVLMGLPLDTPLRLEEIIPGIIDLSELGLADKERCVREALANRPEMVRAEIAIRRARINVEVAKNGTLPLLDLEATYFDSETGRHARDVNDLDNSRRWSIGTLFDLPLPNMARREALRRARSRLEQTIIARDSLERSITEEVRRLFRALESNRARVHVLQKTVVLAEQNLEQVNTRFYEGEGNTTIIDVRNAQDDLFQNRTTYNNARLQYHSDLATLYRAIGRKLFREPLAKNLPDAVQTGAATPPVQHRAAAARPAVATQPRM